MSIDTRRCGGDNHILKTPNNKSEVNAMTQTEVEVKLEGHEHEIGSLKHRVGSIEETIKQIQSLSLSVEKLAMNMESMLSEVKKQGERLEKLEDVPKDNAKAIKAAVITALVGGIIGAALTKILSLII